MSVFVICSPRWPRSARSSTAPRSRRSTATPVTATRCCSRRRCRRHRWYVAVRWQGERLRNAVLGGGRAGHRPERSRPGRFPGTVQVNIITRSRPARSGHRGRAVASLDPRCSLKARPLDRRDQQQGAQVEQFTNLRHPTGRSACRHNRAALLRRACTAWTARVPRGRPGNIELGLNRSTIKTLVDGLAGDGVVAERLPAQRSGAGRPSLLVLPQYLAGRGALAVDIRVEQVTRSPWWWISAARNPQPAELEPAARHAGNPVRCSPKIVDSSLLLIDELAVDMGRRRGVGARSRAPRRRPGARRPPTSTGPTCRWRSGSPGRCTGPCTSGTTPNWVRWPSTCVEPPPRRRRGLRRRRRGHRRWC